MMMTILVEAEDEVRLEISFSLILVEVHGQVHPVDLVVDSVPVAEALVAAALADSVVADSVVVVPVVDGSFGCMF